MLERTCSVEDCENPARARGWCTMHYQRWRKSGTLSSPVPSPYARFMAKTQRLPNGCWEWTGATKETGYAAFGLDGAVVRAHRWVYEVFGASVPEGLVLDHVCHTRDLSCPGGDECPHRRCVNPDHLEPVTRLENTRRGRSCVPATDPRITTGDLRKHAPHLLPNEQAS